MKRIVLFMIIAAVLATGTPAVAQPATPSCTVRGQDLAPQEKLSVDSRLLVMRPGRVTRADGVVYQLPASLAVPSAELVVSARMHGITVVRETIALPATLPHAASVAFLSDNRAVLEKLRQRAARTALRFTISVDGRDVVDIPFADALQGSDSSADPVVVGLSRSVEVKIPGLARAMAKMER